MDRIKEYYCAIVAELLTMTSNADCPSQGESWCYCEATKRASKHYIYVVTLNDVNKKIIGERL